LSHLATAERRTAQTLVGLAERYGTPLYAYDIGTLRRQVEKLRRHIPCSMLYSLKANPSLGLSQLLAAWGLGADVASSGELETALAAGFESRRIFVSGPFKDRETLARMREAAACTISIDSYSDLQRVVESGLHNSVMIRLRPNFESSAAMPMGSDSRFGVPLDELPQLAAYVRLHGIAVAGFHIYSGSQILEARHVCRQFADAFAAAERAGGIMGIAPTMLNLGGGFGVPYGTDEPELDLEPIGAELSRIARRVSPCEVVIELGRYVVAESGWYLTRVVGEQTHRGRTAVVVDGGVHQRSDLCGVGLNSSGRPPQALTAGLGQATTPTDVLGCLCLPDDVLIKSAPLPRLSPGDLLAFPNAGAYGLSASPLAFLAHPIPAEVAYDGDRVGVLRARASATDILRDQHRLDTLS
jgi:diaminopimelate decarboxylase